MTGFKSSDRERFTALFASSISFPDREETRTWSGNNNFFLVAECARGCCVLHNAWEFNLAFFFNSSNRQIKVVTIFSGYTVGYCFCFLVSQTYISNFWPHFNLQSSFISISI